MVTCNSYFSNVLGSFIFLFLENYGVRKLEAFFGFLIATMAVSFAVMFGQTKPDVIELLIGIWSLLSSLSVTHALLTISAPK